MLRNCKIHKQPGPDWISMELFKWLSRNNCLSLLSIMNKWWTQGEVPQETLHARVVPIFEKGWHRRSFKLQTYFLAKHYLQILQHPAWANPTASESKVSTAQLGFRPGRWTALLWSSDVFRIGQSTGTLWNTDLYLALLDWEKAFDKVQHYKRIKKPPRIVLVSLMFSWRSLRRNAEKRS